MIFLLSVRDVARVRTCGRHGTVYLIEQAAPIRDVYVERKRISRADRGEFEQTNERGVRDGW